MILKLQICRSCRTLDTGQFTFENFDRKCGKRAKNTAQNSKNRWKWTLIVEKKKKTKNCTFTNFFLEMHVRGCDDISKTDWIQLYFSLKNSVSRNSLKILDYQVFQTMGGLQILKLNVGKIISFIHSKEIWSYL